MAPRCAVRPTTPGLVLSTIFRQRTSRTPVLRRGVPPSTTCTDCARQAKTLAGGVAKSTSQHSTLSRVVVTCMAKQPKPLTCLPPTVFPSISGPACHPSVLAHDRRRPRRRQHRCPCRQSLRLVVRHPPNLGLDLPARPDCPDRRPPWVSKSPIHASTSDSVSFAHPALDTLAFLLPP